MYKLLRKWFPKWYYNREFFKLQALLFRLDTPCFTIHIPEVYSYIFFGTSCNVKHLRPGVEESMTYLREIAEEGKFDKMEDFLVYHKKMGKTIFKRAKASIRESEKYD